MSLYQTARGSDQVYFDAAVTLLFFLLVGRFLDQRMRLRAAGAAANLLGLRGSAATVIQPDGTTLRLGARALLPGMRILTAAGERFAVDGRVVEGLGEVDESLITGETAPRRVAPGALIHAGTVNLAGSLVTEATATDDNTLLAEIARLMTAAEQGRGRYVRLADRAARFYAPAVHVLGLATFLGWLATGHGWESALTAAIAVLIITCPCALALAVPAVQVAASSRLFGEGHADQGAGRAGAPRRDRHRRVRQDRHAHAGTAVARRELQRQRRCARRRRAPRRRQPPSLRARRGTRRGGQGSRRCASRRRARGRGLRARALGSRQRRAVGLRRLVRRRGRCAVRRLLSRRRRHRHRVRLRGQAAARCGRGGRGAPARRPRNRAPVRRPARGRVRCGRRGGHRALAGPRAADRQDRPPRSPESPGRQGADGRRRPQRRCRARRRPRLALALDGGRHKPDRSRCRVPGREARTRAGDDGRRAHRAPHGAAELRHRARLQRRVRPAGGGGLVTPLLAAIAMSASSIAVTANAVRLRSMRLEGMR